jgi:glycolate oxidase
MVSQSEGKITNFNSDTNLDSDQDNKDNQNNKQDNIDFKPVSKNKHSQYQPIYKKISKIVGEDQVKNDDFEREAYSHDVAALPNMIRFGFNIKPDIITKPRSSKEVSEIVKIASKERVPLIPRGGASWGLGGVVPVDGGVVVDVSHMNNILEIDEENLTVVVESGISWKALYEKLLQKGYFIGSYPSSAYAATVGGWVNTGGVGIGTYKYGSVGDQLRSLEVVLPDGKIIETGFKNVLSNSSGYNLNGIFLGSEGTLGVVTKATLKIYPAPDEIRALSYDFKSINEFCSAVKAISRSKVLPLHLGFLDRNHFDYLRTFRKNVPNISKMALNIALEGDTKMIDVEESILDKIMKGNKAEKLDNKSAQHEWDERYFEMRTKKVGPTLITGEAMVPVSKMPKIINGSYKIFKKMKLQGAITGFISDRNTITIMPYYLTDERKMVKSLLSMSFTKKLSDLAFKNGGRPAGLGIFFAVNIKRMHKDSLELMFDLKSAIDPYNIMNPGKLTEGVTRFGIPIPAIAMNLGMDGMALVKGMMGKDKIKKIKSEG